MQTAKNKKNVEEYKLEALLYQQSLISMIVIITKSIRHQCKNRKLQSPKRDPYAF